jgi:hypothetical protein
MMPVSAPKGLGIFSLVLRKVQHKISGRIFWRFWLICKILYSKDGGGA